MTRDMENIDPIDPLGCGCATVILGFCTAFFIICLGIAWWAISWAWSWSFG